MRRIGIASILVLTAALLAQPAGAARVVDVRVGQHPDYTRVVVELDEPADYRLRTEELPREGGSVSELVLDLEASGAFVMGRPRGLVESIRVKPRGSGSEARIRLATSGPAVKEMVLSDPPRIVLDLRRAPGGGEREDAGAAATAGAGEGEARTAEPAAPAREETPAQAAESGRGPSEEATEAASGGTAPAEPTPQTEPSAEATAEAQGESEAGKTAPADIDEAPDDAPIGAAPEAEAPPGETQQRRSAPSPSPGTAPGEEAALGQPGERPSGARPTPTRERAAPSSQPSQPSSWTEALGDPRLVGMIGVVALLFVVWGILRRRARVHAEARDFPPVPPAEGPLQPDVGEEDEMATVSERDMVRPEENDAAAGGGPKAPEGTEAAGVEPASPVEEPTSPALGAPGEESKPEEAVGDEEPDLPSIPGAGPTATAAASAAASRRGAAAAAPVGDQATQARPVEELERRLHVLESRVEELVDGRERAERQLAAHTEELRVQRSAIARAQRVLRSLTRPEEATEEPAPRGPSRDSGG